MAGALLVLLVGGVAWGEHRGWPWLSAPMAGLLSKSLHRDVDFGEQGARSAVLGGIRIEAETLVIGAPEWSREPYMVRAEGAVLQLAYHDLWRAYRGRPVLVEKLQARRLDTRLERTRDGRASWQFGPPRKDKPARSLADGLQFDVLRIDQGDADYRDEVLDAKVHATMSLNVRDHRRTKDEPGSVPEGLRAKAQGQYRGFPLKATLSSGELAPWLLGGKERMAWPVTMAATIGRASVNFEGTVDQLTLDAQALGRFRAEGPSLAAVGEPLGVTLPTTRDFALNGTVRHNGKVTGVTVEKATIGSSRLAGDFSFDRRGRVPMLEGRLSGPRLDFTDLGPAIGVPADRPRQAEAAAERTRVLPDRAFDLPSLAAMNADVGIDIRQLDLHLNALQPLEPLKGRLVLKDSVLTIRDLQARTAQGELSGRLTLDARQTARARWDTDLAWRNVRIEQWIRQLAPEGRPPYLTGQFDGRAIVKGEGKSTAAILGSLNGTIQGHLRNGVISHLAVEASGLDLAQGLGVLFKGDEPLPITCARADIRAKAGVLQPDLFVINTRDSTVWINGAVSLKDETLGIEAKVAPKDFSVASLRTPIQVKGPLAKPKVAVQASALLPRVAGAVALGVLNPVAAIIPLIDPGNKELARQADAACSQETLHTLKKKAG